MNGWFLKTTDLLDNLYRELNHLMMQTDYLQVDKSLLEVQDPHKKGSLHRGYMWVYRDPVQGLVLYKYDKSRGKQVPKVTLNDFNGTKQTDEYAAYDHLQTNGHIKHIGCLAHCLRKCREAQASDEKRANYALKQIQRLYHIERNAKPVILEMETWLKENINNVLPQSAIGIAMHYTYNQWKKVDIPGEVLLFYWDPVLLSIFRRPADNPSVTFVFQTPDGVTPAGLLIC